MGKLKRNEVIEVYTNPKAPGSFTGISKITRHHFSQKKKKDVVNALNTLDAYTKHKRVIRDFERDRVVVGGIDEQWQIDLMDMRHIAKFNRRHQYVLTVIDVFSKYAWAVPLKFKRNEDVTRAFKEILDKGRKPRCVQSDKGTEFLGSIFQNFLRKENIEFFTSENDEIKAGIVERLNRTLKEKIWKYFTYNGTHNYIDVLQAIVFSYNHTYHSSLKMTPSQINEKNEENVFYEIYKPSKKQIRNVWKPKKERKVENGDRVRIVKTRGAFDKGYEPNWTTEVFTVKALKGKRGCIIEDDAGEEIKGVFYPEEVQKIIKPVTDTYPIEKVIKYRGKGKRKEAYIKWKGYGEKFNTWIPTSEITKISK